jgi:hypothetical protein
MPIVGERLPVGVAAPTFLSGCIALLLDVRLDIVNVEATMLTDASDRQFSTQDKPSDHARQNAEVVRRLFFRQELAVPFGERLLRLCGISSQSKSPLLRNGFASESLARPLRWVN